MTRLQTRVRELEAERATHQAVSQEAQRQLAVLEAELVLVLQAERADRYRQALAQRDRVMQIVAAMVEELAPKLAELRRLEREAYAASNDAGTPHSARWRQRFDENLAERLGLGNVRNDHRHALADFAAEPSRVLVPLEI